MKTDKKQTVGLGFSDALAILFIGLKLGKVIDWSWVRVLSPIWIVVVLTVLIYLLKEIE